MNVTKLRRAALPYPAILVLLIGCIGLAAQSATYLNHDVAWVLYSSQRLLDGGVFGQDIVAANPPLIWWICTIPMSIARASGAPPAGVFRLFVAALAIFSLAACQRLMTPHFPRTARALILSLGAYLLFIGVHRDYGQREHLAVIMIVPYLLAVAHRARHGTLPIIFSVIIGIGAGVGICFKPYFLVVPLIIEAGLAWRVRTLAILLRPETIAAFAFGVTYVAAAALYASPYFDEVLPAIWRLYWAFSAPLSSIVLIYGWLIAILIVLIFVVWRSGWPFEASVAALAAIGFLIAALAQAKGYSYHFYPVLAFTLLSFALMRTRSTSLRLITNGMMIGVLLFSVWQSASILIDRSLGGTYGASAARMVSFVQANVPQDGRFLALSTHPYPGFPTALYARREWGAASNSRLFLPAVVRLREDEAFHTDPSLLQFAENKEWASLRQDIETPPDLVIIDVRPVRHAIGDSKFDFLAFYQEAPWFQRFWRKYRELKGAPPGFRAFVLVRRAGS